MQRNDIITTNITNGDLIFWRYNFSFSNPLPKEGCPCKQRLTLDKKQLRESYWHAIGIGIILDKVQYIFCMGILPKKPILITFNQFLDQVRGISRGMSGKTSSGPIVEIKIYKIKQVISNVLEDRLHNLIADQLSIDGYNESSLVETWHPVVYTLEKLGLLKSEPWMDIDSFIPKSDSKYWYSN